MQDQKQWNSKTLFVIKHSSVMIKTITQLSTDTDT